MALSGPKLQDAARTVANRLPETSNSRPFTESLDVYKVAGKVFLIVTDDPDEPIITVKAEPERGRVLREDHPSITRGRYLDKTHWISIGPGERVTRQLVSELVEDSYLSALEGVPRKDWPTDARTRADSNGAGKHA